jgi:hypothetical protein
MNEALSEPVGTEYLAADNGVVMTSLLDGSVFLSVGLCHLICTASLQHLILLRKPVHAQDG